MVVFGSEIVRSDSHGAACASAAMSPSAVTVIMAGYCNALVRAIGLTRRQTRRMIRHESVLTALLGAFVGIVRGLILAGLLIAKVDFLIFSFPTTQVIVVAIAAIIVGILAAIFPARRAAKLNPLEALHYE